jgi:hypothetical protein
MFLELDTFIIHKNLNNPSQNVCLRALLYWYRNVKRCNAVKSVFPQARCTASYIVPSYVTFVTTLQIPCKISITLSSICICYTTLTAWHCLLCTSMVCVHVTIQELAVLHPLLIVSQQSVSRITIFPALFYHILGLSLFQDGSNCVYKHFLHDVSIFGSLWYWNVSTEALMALRKRRMTWTQCSQPDNSWSRRTSRLSCSLMRILSISFD